MSKEKRGRFLTAAWLSVFLFVGGFIPGDTLALNEAPILTPLVKANKLPSVDKRLPPSPPVVHPIESNGAYGGTWRRAYTGLTDLVGARRILYDPLVRWSPDFEIIPNLAEKWEIDETGRIFTFYLVKGVRWSDGVPFTADDIIFYFEDILSNKDLTPALPRWVSPDGIPPKVTKIDDYAIRIEFAKPYSLFLQRLACPEGMELVTKPKHYLKKFHKTYAEPEELQALMKEKKASSWLKLFEDVADWHTLFLNTDLPSICAWITKVPAPATRLVMQRNPYYWKVDPNGNQLPYIDSIVHELLAEPQTILLKAIAGEIDMQGRLLGGMRNSILLMANKSEGKYKLVPKMSTASVGLLLAPNLNHKNTEMRKILSDHRFRKALSHAINRNEINKIVYRGQGVPRQAAPLKESSFYSESYEKAYLEYAPEKAKALLDEMGLKVGSHGKRMRPDGKPLRLVLDVTVVVQDWVDAAAIIASNLEKIGIDTEVKTETRALFRERVQSAAHDIALWSGDGGMECLLDPRWYFPYSSESLNAPLYGLWYQTRGKQGEEPPLEIRELTEIYDRILTTTSQDKIKGLFGNIIAANEKDLWVIGLVIEPPDYYVAGINFHNLPKKDFQSWMYPNPGPVHPEQFFMTPK
ncbi:MAG TPA: ABC transporter substrate-binding protein [Desulfomonilaceae bacterium]|nr:ABC transporter substrate-binding protein [Desulfomonilaceae bacterium]HVN80194.1 ABC transporter substrate-binding protein [Terriglobia bacterium]